MEEFKKINRRISVNTKKIILFLLLSVISFTNQMTDNGFKVLEGYPKNYERDHMDGYGGKDYIINNKNPYKLLMYFKVYGGGNQYLNQSLQNSDDRNDVLKFFNIDSLDIHYSSDFIELKNGEKFLYGRIILDFNDLDVKLELYYIDSNNESKKKVFIKERNFNIFNILYKINSDNTEGYYGIPPYGEKVTIITKDKIIYKRTLFLLGAEKEMYENFLELFKDEIPEEFFEKRNRYKD